MNIFKKLFGKFQSNNADFQDEELPFNTLGPSNSKYVVDPSVVFIINGKQYKVGIGKNEDFVLKRYR